MLKDLIQAGLVAGDAGVDFIAAILGGLEHEIRIGQQGPRHGNHVRVAARKNGFRHLRRVDAIGGDEGNMDFTLHAPGHPGIGAARDHGADGGNPRLVPADAGVDDRSARGLHGLGELHDLFPGGSIGHQVEHGKPINQDKVGPHGFTGAPHDLHRKAHAVFVIAAPFIGSAVGAGHQELIDQVALAAHDFHAVVARILGVTGAGHVVADRAFNPSTRKRRRLERRDGRLHIRGRHGKRMVAVASAVENLHRDFPATRVHRFGDQAMLSHLPRPAELRAKGSQTTPQIRRDAAGNDKPHTAFGPLRKKGGHLLEAAPLFLQSGVHGAHEHSVGERGEPEIEGGQKVGEGHGILPGDPSSVEPLKA